MGESENNMSASVWDPAGQEIPVINATSTLYPQVFTATAGQTHFVITNFQFIPNTGSVLIFANGVFQIITKNFTEGSDGASFDFTTAELQAGDEVVALGFVGITATTPPTIAASITYGATTLADILLNHSELIVNSYAALRAVQHIYWSFAYLTGAVTRGDGLGGGFYYYDATDTTSADNGSTIIVAADGGRWKLINNSAGIVTQPIGDNSTNPATTKFVQQSHVSALTHLIHPSTDGKWRDMYKAGIHPGFHNQQCGGGIIGWELNDGATDTVVAFDSATQQSEDYIGASTPLGLGNLSTNIWRSQGFKVGENLTVQAVWIKLYKTTNPVDNVKAVIFLDDGTGKPTGFVGITNGTAGLINNRQIISKVDGEWYRFVFAIPPALLAANQYHIGVNKSGAVDATNFSVVKCTITGKYPFGTNCLSDGATWTTGTALTQLDFIIEPVAANQFLRQTGGLVDIANYVFNEGAQLTHSKVFVDRMVNFANNKLFTQLLRVSNIPLGKTLFDLGWGLNHNRLVVSCDTATGFLRATLYDSNKNQTTIVNGTSVAGAALMDIAVIMRSMNDGADYLQLWINGVMAVQTAGVSYNMSQNWKDLGTRWIGGGFPLAPGWVQDMNMTTLPSAQGWTYGGTATEANVFQVANGKLYQNKDGYAATDTGFYTHAATGFNNSIGWVVRFRLRDLFSDNAYTTVVTDAACITINDGTKNFGIAIHEYFIWTGNAATDFIAQLDTKTWDTEFVISGKGSDYFVFANNRLVIDGTGKLLTATAANTITFGDQSATSGENADIVWTDFSYYNGGVIQPVVATGMILHEAGYFAGNQSAYLPAIYNAAVPVSIKNYWNQARNYVQDIPWTITMFGVTADPINSTTTLIRVLDMESYCLGSNFNIIGNLVVIGNTLLQATATITVDGGVKNNSTRLFTPAANTYAGNLVPQYTSIGYSGLHKFEIEFSASNNIVDSSGVLRSLNIASSANTY